jgi:hypothetical protein
VITWMRHLKHSLSMRAHVAPAWFWFSRPT